MIAVTGIIIFILVISGCALKPAGSAEAERISAKQLQGMLGRSDVIVVDVRAKSDWHNSESKITGAVWEDLSAISSWMDKYPKGKTLIYLRGIFIILLSEESGDVFQNENYKPLL